MNLRPDYRCQHVPVKFSFMPPISAFTSTLFTDAEEESRETTILINAIAIIIIRENIMNFLFAGEKSTPDITVSNVFQDLYTKETPLLQAAFQLQGIPP